MVKFKAKFLLFKYNLAVAKWQDNESIKCCIIRMFINLSMLQLLPLCFHHSAILIWWPDTSIRCPCGLVFPMPMMTIQPLDTADKWDQSCYMNARSIVLQSSAVNNGWTQTKNISVDGNVCVTINTMSMIMYIILFW